MEAKLYHNNNLFILILNLKQKIFLRLSFCLFFSTLSANTSNFHLMLNRLTDLVKMIRQRKLVKFRPLKINNFFAFATKEMVMLGQIRLKSYVIKNLHPSDEPQMLQGRKGPVNSIQGNGGHIFLNALINGFCRRVILGLAYDIINHDPLMRKPKSFLFKQPSKLIKGQFFMGILTVFNRLHFLFLNFSYLRIA